MISKAYLVVLLLFLSCAEKNKNKTSENLYYNKAWDAWESKNDKEAFENFNRAKIDFLKADDKMKVAKCIINMSIIMGDNGDYYGSQETSLEAIHYLNPATQEEKEILSSNYNNLGKVANRLEDYLKAEEFYKNAISLTSENSSKLIYYNNLANNYRYKKEYFTAIKVYDSLFSESTIKADMKNYARVLDNLAFTKFLQNPNYNALPELYEALSIREKEDDLWGQNASHAHLSDYFYEKDKSQSLTHAYSMFSFASELNSPDDQLEALQKLILLEVPEKSKEYFLKYQNLNDSLQTARSKAKNQFALIRYETEKEKADNEKKQNYILKQYVAIGALFIGLIFIPLYFVRRQKRLQQEKDLEVKNTKLVYSRKVHDVVANGLYHTMVEIQNNKNFSREQSLDRIEKMYEESRNIARDDLDEVMEKEFPVRLFEMVNSYSSDHQKALLSGNTNENWDGVSNTVQSELFYVLREAMTNMKKHSKATLAFLKIEKVGNQLSVRYTDNGLGIENLEEIKKSGLQNMENRIAAIHGKIIFEQNPKGGLIIFITVPTV